MKSLIPPQSSPPHPISPFSPPAISRRLALSLPLLHLPPLAAALPSLSSPPPSLCPPSAAVTSKAFLDISIAGVPAGRITIGLFGLTYPAAVARFASLASGSAGASFRRKEFVKIAPTFVQHAGIRSSGGDRVASGELVSEWAAEADRCEGLRSTKGIVGIVVRSVGGSGPASRIVARNGRVEVVEEEAAGPNGTEFVIATRDSPEMDGMAVAVGRVVGGMEVVEKIAGVSAVRDNTGSPYFRFSKLFLFYLGRI